MFLLEITSPIFKAELTHHRHHLSGVLPIWLRKLWGGLVLLGAAVALLLIVVEFASAATGYDIPYVLYILGYNPITVIHVLPVVVLLPVTFVLHFSALVQTLILASNTISRERNARMWGLLVLSPQSANHIMTMKFGATVWHMLPQYSVLAILRVGVVLYLGLEMGRNKYFYYSSALSNFVTQIEPLFFLPDQPSIIMAVALIVFFTLLNLPFTTSLGVLVSSLGCRRCLLGSFLLRQAGLLLTLSRPQIALSSATILEAVGLTLLDNGTGMAAAVASPMKIFAPFELGVLVYSFVPSASVVVPLLYGLVTIGALWIARKRIINDGALA